MVQLPSECRSKENKDDVEILEGKADLWTPLNCLLEAANRKSSRLNSQGSATSKAETNNGPDCHSYLPEAKVGPESPAVPDGKLYVAKTKNKDPGQQTKVHQDEENETNLIARPVKRRRLRAAAQKKSAAEQQAASARVILDALGAKWNRKNSPIWFSLVAFEDQ